MSIFSVLLCLGDTLFSCFAPRPRCERWGAHTAGAATVSSALGLALSPTSLVSCHLPVWLSASLLALALCRTGRTWVTFLESTTVEV